MKNQYVEQQCIHIVRYITMEWCCIYTLVEKHIWFDLHCTFFIRKTIPPSINHCFHLQKHLFGPFQQAKKKKNNLELCFRYLPVRPEKLRSPPFVLYFSGDYRAEQCNGPNCIQCYMENPSCEGHKDGENHHSSKPGSPWRMECYKGRLVGTFLADLNQDWGPGAGSRGGGFMFIYISI